LPVCVTAGDGDERPFSDEEAWKAFQRGALSVSRESGHRQIALDRGSVCRKQFLFVGWACTQNTPILLFQIRSEAKKDTGKRGLCPYSPGLCPVEGAARRLAVPGESKKGLSKLLGRLLEKLKADPLNDGDLQERYFAFKELSSANDVALRDLVGLEGSLSEAQSLPGCDLHARATEFTVQAFKSIRNLETVAHRPYPDLRETLTSLTRRMEKILLEGSAADERDIPVERIVGLLAPLNLTNPGHRSFRPAGCRTVHDILRFCQEESINSMFSRNDADAVRKGRFFQLGISVPLRIFVADLGGGLEGIEKKRPEIDTRNVASVPFRALIEGMTTEGVRWAGHVPMGIKSMVSVFANTLYDPVKHERNLGARSYAVVSGHYLNFSSRLGYHFSTLDASCGRKTNRGYISFRFKGGAASPEKRFRRAEFIARILRAHDFWVNQQEDLVNANLKRSSEQDILDRLVMLGRLMGCARQLDVAMDSPQRVNHFVDLFLQGQYNFFGLSSPS